MPIVTAVSVGARGYGWSAATATGIVWDFTTYSGTTPGANTGACAANSNGAAFCIWDTYGTSLTDRVWYWSDITSNTTATTGSRAALYYASGTGYFAGYFWQIGGAVDQYHNFAEVSVYTYHGGSSWTNRSAMPNGTSRCTAAFSQDGSAGLFYFPGSKYPSYEGFPVDNLNKFYKLTSLTGSWTACANTPVNYSQGMYPAYTSGGYVTIVNGWTTGTYYAYRYNISANSWQVCAAAPKTGIGYWGIPDDDKYWFIDYSNTSAGVAYSLKETDTAWSVGKAVTGTVNYTGYVITGQTVYNLNQGTKTPTV
jgi:hypothetical protein